MGLELTAQRARRASWRVATVHQQGVLWDHRQPALEATVTPRRERALRPASRPPPSRPPASLGSPASPRPPTSVGLPDPGHLGRPAHPTLDLETYNSDDSNANEDLGDEDIIG